MNTLQGAFRILARGPETARSLWENPARLTSVEGTLGDAVAASRLSAAEAEVGRLQAYSRPRAAASASSPATSSARASAAPVSTRTRSPGYGTPFGSGSTTSIATGSASPRCIRARSRSRQPARRTGRSASSPSRPRRKAIPSPPPTGARRGTGRRPPAPAEHRRARAAGGAGQGARGARRRHPPKLRERLVRERTFYALAGTMTGPVRSALMMSATALRRTAGARGEARSGTAATPAPPWPSATTRSAAGSCHLGAWLSSFPPTSRR
jgi:hypothetical protein